MYNVTLMYTPLTENFMASKNLVELNADIPCVVAGHLISSISRQNTNTMYNIIYQISNHIYIVDISYHIIFFPCGARHLVYLVHHHALQTNLRKNVPRSVRHI